MSFPLLCNACCIPHHVLDSTRPCTAQIARQMPLPNPNLSDKPKFPLDSVFRLLFRSQMYPVTSKRFGCTGTELPARKFSACKRQ